MARAKKTARTDARRRYRVEQGIPDPTLDTGTDPAASRAAANRVADTLAPQQRMSIGSAFRQSFTTLDVRGDFRALPWIAVHTKALWLPVLITIGATIAFYFTQGTDLVTRFLFAYFIQTPAIGGVFLAGFLAPRASWLLGVIVGLIAAACYSFLILTVFAAVSATAPTTTGLSQEIIVSSFVLSPLMGAFFASAAAWYRRFLALSNPNRGRREAAAKAASRPDGKTRAAPR